jgi:APA family basic amino acid/polyamine antiporter
MTKTITTKELKKVLGFWDLLSTAVGQIIGAGVMSLLGIGIGMTGRSVVLALFIAAVFSIISIVPLIITSGTVRVRGGQYTITALLAGKRFAGVYVILSIVSNITIAMFALSFTEYFLALFWPGGPGKLIAVLCITVFYLVNLLGIDKMAKVQNVIVAIMCIGLGLLAAFGIGKVSPDFFSRDFMTHGFRGLMTAAALLSFATSGAFSIVNLSGEAKNPTRDIPLAAVVSTLLVAVLYGFLAVVASGVLPVDQVAYKPLAGVAEAVLPRPVYYFFMVGGAMFALITTLNAQLGWATKPVLQACVDGWFSRKLAYLHPKFKTPVILLTIFYFFGVVPILIDFNVGVIGSLATIVSQISFVIVGVALFRLPKVVPAEWNKSRFRVSGGLLHVIVVIAGIGGSIPIYFLVTDVSPAILIGNFALVIAGILYSIWRYNTKKVEFEISYEEC